MSTSRRKRYSVYLFELISVFLGVTLAFALNQCNENRRLEFTEEKTLTEISNGLDQDLKDIEENITGHDIALRACDWFKRYIRGEEVDMDSTRVYFISLTRDFISVQNTAAYQSLKSKGLDLIESDSLRIQIISLYEYYFQIIEKLEEDYPEMQYYTSYAGTLEESLSRFMEFDETGKLIGFTHLPDLREKEEKTLLALLWRIQLNREFILEYYKVLKEKIGEVQSAIREEV